MAAWRRFAFLFLLVVPVLVLVVFLFCSMLSAPGGPAVVGPADRSAVLLAVFTPSAPLASPAAGAVLDISSDLPRDTVRVCVGNAVRFRNRLSVPAIVAAKDHSFSSGVLLTGDEFVLVLAAVGEMDVEVVALSPTVDQMGEFRVEVMRCGER